MLVMTELKNAPPPGRLRVIDFRRRKECRRIDIFRIGKVDFFDIAAVIEGIGPDDESIGKLARDDIRAREALRIEIFDAGKIDVFNGAVQESPRADIFHGAVQLDALQGGRAKECRRIDALDAGKIDLRQRDISRKRIDADRFYRRGYLHVFQVLLVVEAFFAVRRAERIIPYDFGAFAEFDIHEKQIVAECICPHFFDSRRNVQIGE